MKDSGSTILLMMIGHKIEIERTKDSYIIIKVAQIRNYKGGKEEQKRKLAFTFN